MKTNPFEGKWLTAALLGVALLTGCQQKREDIALWELEQSRIELQESLKLAEYRLQVHHGGKLDELNALTTALAGISGKKQNLQIQRTALVEDVASLEQQTVEIELAWIQQQRAISRGASFAKFTTKDGRTLENACVTQIDDGGVSIRHDHGAAKLRFDDLTPEQQEQFGLLEARAEAAENRELIASAAYEKHVEEHLQSAREQEQERQQTSALARNNQSTRVSPPPVSPATSPSDNPLHQSATRFGGRSWSTYSYSRDRGTSYRYLYPTGRSCSPYYKRDFKQESSGLRIIPNPYTGQTTIK